MEIKLGCIFTLFLIISCNQPQIKRAEDRTILDKGNTEGTYVFDYQLKFLERYKPEFPVRVTIRKLENQREELKDFIIGSMKNSKITVNLKPGKYQIVGEVINRDAVPLYTAASGPVFEIDNAGSMKISDMPLIFKRNIMVIAPELGESFSINGLVPCLRWLPLKNASHYQVSWQEFPVNSTKSSVSERAGKLDDLQVPEFCFDFLLKTFPGKYNESIIQWEIIALDKDNFQIGRETGSFSIK